jgi:hypothetical protein
MTSYESRIVFGFVSKACGVFPISMTFCMIFEITRSVVRYGLGTTTTKDYLEVVGQRLDCYRRGHRQALQSHALGKLTAHWLFWAYA